MITQVNYKSIKVNGGLQRIQTVDGYIIPLNIKGRLTHLKMRPYTDKEWGILSHVIMTVDVDWDPSVLHLPLIQDTQAPNCL